MKMTATTTEIRCTVTVHLPRCQLRSFSVLVGRVSVGEPRVRVAADGGKWLDVEVSGGLLPLRAHLLILAVRVLGALGVRVDVEV